MNTSHGFIKVAILAGGHSERMGVDKSFALLHERPLIAHVIEQVRTLGYPLIVIANDAERYRSLGLPVFSDVLPEKGSLGGIYTALSVSETEYTLCVACDMPFLNPALLTYLATRHHGCDAVVPLVGARPQGLHALYHRACLPSMRNALEHNRLKIGDYLREISACYVDERDLKQFDPDLRSFTNVNTPEELRRAEAIR